MIDCFLIGFNDVSLEGYVETVRSMGARSGAYRDLNLAFITHNGRPYTSMDLLNLYYRGGDSTERKFSNVDFLWPVILYLHTYLTRRGFTIDYVNLFQDEKERLIEGLKSGKVRTVAITTTLYVWVGPILEIVQFVRKYSPTTKIIIGGPYVQNQARLLEREGLHRLFQTIGADIYIISAEGEFTLSRVLQALRSNSSLAEIENIVFRNGGAMVQTAESTEANSLAENMVDYSLFDADTYNGMVSLRTAKSCPFSCSFCAFPQRAGRYTYLQVELVEQELDAIRRIGMISTLSFIDDTFNVPKERFKEILRMMIRKGYGFRWNSYLRTDHADSECVELMQRSGCEGVFLGVESGSDRILKAMNKTSRREDYMRIIPQLRSAGIVTHASTIVGFPGETLETVQETMDLIEAARPDFYRAQLWYCDPTTPVWQRRDELQIKGEGFNWSHPTMDSETASELVECLFLAIKGSTWLPQYGFEPWSLYYLQRRGLTLAGLKRFISTFNAAVGEKIADPSREEVSPEALSAIREACQSEVAAPPRAVRSENYEYQS